MTDPYAFADDPANGRYPANLDTITDAQTHGDAILEYNNAVGADVTEPDAPNRPVMSDSPSLFMSQRLPRNPLVGDCVTRTINLFPGVTQPLVQRNINRYRLTVWTDQNNVGGVMVIGSNGEGVVLGANSLPVEFHSHKPFTVSVPNVAGTYILYVVEESYFVNEDGK